MRGGRGYPVRSPDMPEDIPRLTGTLVAGKYRVMQLIGTGGMGTVWEGVHATLGTRVAVKFIKPRFAEQAEARAPVRDRGAPRPS